MKERINNLIKPLVILAVSIFCVCYFVKQPTSLDGYWSCLSNSITGVVLFFMLYERYLWSFIPWNKPPVLKKHYEGIIHYEYKKQSGVKSIEIKVKQTLLSIEVTTKTDINSSVTVVGDIVKEYGENVLYYTYITNPRAIGQDKNPIQYGTCRMVLDSNNEVIVGKYWTTSKTIGDIEWKYIA